MKTPLPPWSAGGAAKVPRFVGGEATGSCWVAKLRRSPAHRGAARSVGGPLRIIREVAADNAPRDAHGGHSRAPRALDSYSPPRTRLRHVHADPAAGGGSAGARRTIWLDALVGEHHRYSFGECMDRCRTLRCRLSYRAAVRGPRCPMLANLTPSGLEVNQHGPARFVPLIAATLYEMAAERIARATLPAA